MKFLSRGVILFLLSFLGTGYVFAQPRVEYLFSISKPRDIGVKKGIFGRGGEFLFGKTEEEKIIRPYGILSDGKDKIYVVDNDLAVVHFFDLKKKKYQQLFRLPQGRLLSPLTCALDIKGNLYVSDNLWRGIVVFDKKGRYLRNIKIEKLLNPTGIAVGKNNSLYIVDMSAHKIWVYSLGGAHRPEGSYFSFGKRGGGEGEFNYPSNIFIDSQGLVYVTDAMNFRIQVFDERGNFLRKFGEIGDGPGFFSRPKGVAVDRKGNIFVVDALKNTVEIFDSTGKYLGFFGSEGSGAGQFSLPAGIFIDEEDKIYLADSYNSRIQVFRFLP